MTKTKRLTELDYCVLAVIWRIEQPTAYQVRKVFQDSLTASWQASTGSIYPILRRLLNNGLVSEHAVIGSKRGARLLSITRPGEEAVRQWALDRPDWISAPVADPMRTRSYILPMLDGPHAREIVDKWRATTLSTLKNVEDRLSSYRRENNKIEILAHRGTQLQLRARIEWLSEMAAALKD